MKKAIDWKTLGISEVYLAESGEKALKILETSEVFIIITDIRMKGISGIELIEKVKEQKPDIKVIVMTAYDEFEYAQKGLRLHVDDFLVKPVDENRLVEIVYDLVRKKEEEIENQHKDILKRRVRGNTETQKLGRIMRELLTEGKKTEELLKELKNVYQYEVKQRLQAVIFYPRIEEKMYLSYALQEFCANNIDLFEQGITFRDSSERLVIAFFCTSGKNTVYNHRIDEFMSLLNSEFHISQKVAVGSIVEGFSQLSRSYHEAVLLMEETLDAGIDIMENAQIRKRKVLFQDIFDEIKNRMLNDAGDVQAVYRAFQTLSRMTESYDLSLQTVRRCCFEFAMTVYYGHILNCRAGKQKNIQEFTEAITTSDTEGVLSITYSFLKDFYDVQEEEVHETVEKAKNYIQEHLTEKLSVSYIAQKYYISPAYFSRLFKKVQGEGCNEYIMRMRMEKASYLLRETTIKTGEIAVQAGYSDKNYFSLTFKKYTGMSPTAYRTKFQNEEQ